MQRAVERDSEIIQIMPCVPLTRAESRPLSVMWPFVKLLTVLLPTPPPSVAYLRLLIIMLRWAFFVFDRHPFRFLMLLQGQQYVCAGELIALQTTNVLNYLKVQKVDLQK